MGKILDGLIILRKYAPEDALEDFNAEYDQIWVRYKDNQNKDGISEEDLARLDELGWFIDEEFDCWSHFC